MRLANLALMLITGGATPGALAAAELCSEPPADRSLPAIALQEVATGFDQPVHVTHAGDGSGRLFVVEQPGVIRIIEDGKVLPEPFLDISDQVTSGGERGLLSVAFHPDYRRNGYFYVNYTARRGFIDAAKSGFRDGLTVLATVVARFERASERRADPDSERIVLKIGQPYGNHNGGQLAFGPDGFLYIGMGDGGAGNDPHNHGQDRSTLLGAMLRIDVDKKQDDLNYAIPADNPFVDRNDARGEIWAYGLRNPWRFSFDRQTDRLFAGDVGQDAVEEIDLIRKGKNYGWNIMEGDICTPTVNRECDKTGLEPPAFTYPHPEGFSVTGGYVYRGSAIPDLCGVYLFADYVTRRLWGLRHVDGRVTVHEELAPPGINISSFGEDENSELYVAAHQTGRLLKIVAAK